MDQNERIIRLPEVIALTGISKSTIERLEKRGEFPMRRKLSPSSSLVGWLLSDVQGWVHSRKQRSIVELGVANDLKNSLGK
jgi:prophage regulatory protein